MGVVSLVTGKLTVSQGWIDIMNWFLVVGANSGKLKVVSMIFGWACSKVGVTMRP